MRRWSTIVVNDSYRLCPWADALYACDRDWWGAHIEGVRAAFKGALWTSNKEAALKYEIAHIEGHQLPGLSSKPGVIHYNSNSGAQAINLATLWGAKRLILVGFDMKLSGGKRHWFGDHPGILNKRSDYSDWVRKFDRIAKDLDQMGVEVINTSMESALPYFRKCPLPTVS